eukprot:gene13696-16186_t
MSPSRRFIPHTGVLCATAPDEEQSCSLRADLLFATRGGRVILQPKSGDRTARFKRCSPKDDSSAGILKPPLTKAERVVYTLETLRLVPSETSPSISPPLSLSFPMNICIMVVGDVLPFIALGRRLREEGGHRVRLASHKHHEDLVKRNGLEYYPLGGDPKQLSEWMVQSKGSLLPLNLKALEAAPLKLQMINEILFSTWPACTAADPAPNALGVPLHLMFPQPWTPTCAFPHPLAREIRFSQNRYVNWQSYFAVDDYMFMGTMKITNRFRVRIGLGRLRVGQRDLVRSATMYEDSPTMYDDNPAIFEDNPIMSEDNPTMYEDDTTMYKDDPTMYEDNPNVGSFSLNQPSFYSPDPKLVEWLEAGEKPIYVGFGSMVLGDPEAVLALRE